MPIVVRAGLSASARRRSARHIVPTTPAPIRAHAMSTSASSASRRRWAASYDLAEPLSTLLRKATTAAHDDVERAPVVNLLITGRISRALHTRYLICLCFIYESVGIA